MDISDIVNLTSRSWSLHILAALHRGTAGRQAPLLAATGASRTSFGQSLKHLITLNLLERNPGHGHPLRPEFRLTAKGQRIAAIAHQVLTLENNQTDKTLLRRTWTLPILAVSNRPRHFSHLKSHLPAITDRALSQSLKSIEAHDWIARSIDTQSRPPRPLYHAINEGAQISAIAQRLAG